MQFFYSKFCVQPDAYDLTDLINKKIHPFFCEKIRRHEDTIDPDSPRDYLDYLILDAQENDEIGFIAIAWTLLVLYVAGSDTLATTMQWFCLNLTAFPKIQGKGLLNTFSHFINFNGSKVLNFQNFAGPDSVRDFRFFGSGPARTVRVLPNVVNFVRLT